MPEKNLSYDEYRDGQLPEDYQEPEEDDTEFYQIPEEKPESDALMGQYSEMQDQLLNIEPETEEYNNHLQTMSGIMDQLLEINPNLSVRGEAQRLRRLADPVSSQGGQSKMSEAQSYENEWDSEEEMDYDQSTAYPEPPDTGYTNYGDVDGEVPIESDDPPMSYEEYAAIRDRASGIDLGEYPQVAGGATASDEDPEDAQARDDLNEMAGVYGLKLGGVKDPKTGVVSLSVTKGGLKNRWTQTFSDYVQAMDWMKKNPSKLR